MLPRAGRLSWLLLQSLYTHGDRLQLLPRLGVGARVLDVGAGTGALALDLAWLLGAEAEVTALDNDPAALDLLRAMAAHTGLAVEGIAGSAYALPLAAARQHLTLARFLFQHLERPAAALREMVRVTAPGGRIAINCVDDGAGATEPPLAPALRRLYDAIAALQSRRGGDRHMGRRLYHLMREAGLVEIEVSALPRVRLGTYHGRSEEAEAYQRLYLEGYREALLEGEIMDAAAFDAAMAALERGFAEDRFEFQAEFLAVGRVPL